jgi:hypothetical protein
VICRPINKFPFFPHGFLRIYIWGESAVLLGCQAPNFQISLTKVKKKKKSAWHRRGAWHHARSQPAWMAAMDGGCVDARVFAKQKPETQKRHGCRFWVAQGIEAEIPQNLVPGTKFEELERKARSPPAVPAKGRYGGRGCAQNNSD